MNAAIVPSELEPGVESGENITPRLTVDQIVRVYEGVVTDVREAFEKISDAERRLNAVFTLEHTWGIHVQHRHVSYDDPGSAVKELDRDVWGLIIAQLEVKRLMSIKAAKQLDEQIQKGDMPPITVESVTAVARGFAGSMKSMLDDAVEEVFEWLRPRRSEYKTNSELEIGRKVILSWAVEAAWSAKGFRLNYNKTQNFRALENVFSALDGKGSITKTYSGKLADAIEASGPAGRGETEYFRFKCFRNRNLHLEFLRLDLLERFNAIAGGRRLRPGPTSQGEE